MKTRLTLWAILPLLAAACARTPSKPPSPADGEWPAWGRDPRGNRFSPLAQINKQNVARLAPAWTFHTGELGSEGNSKWVFECTPLMAENKLFLVSPLSRAIALDPCTGKELWTYDPMMKVKAGVGMLASRGAAYWKKDGKGRIILPTLDGRMILLDATSGRPDESFGNKGSIDLKTLLNAPQLKITSPPAIYRDLAIQGCSMPDAAVKNPPVPVVAVDLRSGKIIWRFNTIPQNAEFGTQSWEKDSWKDRGGVNVWAPMSVDPERGMVFLPATSPTADFYGGDRRGQNLFANCVLALDAATGRRLWHYQTVHHDLWDYDLPAQPNLVDLKIKGKKIPALAQVGKTGFVYLLHRETGAPIFPILERPVPASDVPGEAASPTQPFPTKPPPFTAQGLTEKNLTRLDSASRDYVLGEFRKYRSEGIFTPPSIRGSINFPGFHGGANWSGAACDARTGVMYVNSTELACIQWLIETPQGDFRYKHKGYERFRDKNGYPANAPPWGQLTAIDLNKGEILWQKPLGEFEALAKRGIPPTGQENFGGATVTAGGLVFIASTMDEKLRAFDKDDGKILFTAKLDAAGYAAPITYLGADGKQYVVICAGGGGKRGTPEGDSVMAFRLPRAEGGEVAYATDEKFHPMRGSIGPSRGRMVHAILRKNETPRSAACADAPRLDGA
ncbi:pyrroloquinoline quinone-dependent dehydrogenase [Candidatus Sumerlaeota bacterium]|nr:pyrroloquinoline quinone-dependent dehydrogenase [Candidatus Sumerlaeota bacterium]